MIEFSLAFLLLLQFWLLGWYCHKWWVSLRSVRLPPGEYIYRVEGYQGRPNCRELIRGHGEDDYFERLENSPGFIGAYLENSPGFIGAYGAREVTKVEISHE